MPHFVHNSAEYFPRDAPGPCETYPDSLNEMNLDVTIHWFYQSHIVSAKNRLLKRYDKCSPEPCKALWLTKALEWGKTSTKLLLVTKKDIIGKYSITTR